MYTCFFTVCKRVLLFVCLSVLPPRTLIIRHSIILCESTQIPHHCLLSLVLLLLITHESLVSQNINNCIFFLLFSSYLLFPLPWPTRCHILCECYRQVIYLEGVVICFLLACSNHHPSDSFVCSGPPVFFTLQPIACSETRPQNRFNCIAAWSFHYFSLVFSDALFHFYVVEKFESS